MKINEFKSTLNNLEGLRFVLPDGSYIPAHFHITEVGLNTKHFIDCGGTVREERTIIFQLWEAGDYDHRLSPHKLLGILRKSEKIIGNEDLDIEVEYQGSTIGRYGLKLEGTDFRLTNKYTDCLAREQCGLPKEDHASPNSEPIRQQAACCAPGSSCC